MLAGIANAPEIWDIPCPRFEYINRIAYDFKSPRAAGFTTKSSKCVAPPVTAPDNEATAASVQLCAGLPNFDILEYQWGEVDWRGDLVDPPELFEDGHISVPGAPGFGIELNERVVREHA